MVVPVPVVAPVPAKLPGLVVPVVVPVLAKLPGLVVPVVAPVLAELPGLVVPVVVPGLEVADAPCPVGADVFMARFRPLLAWFCE
jgi:hypothetical protein